MAGDRRTQLDTQARRAFVLDLRKSGATYRQVAAATIKRFGDTLPKGYDCRYASSDVRAELGKLQAINEKYAEDIRNLEIERLDTMLLALWKRATSVKEGGDLQAVDRVIKIMDRRARYISGLNAPAQLEVRDWREEAQEAGFDPAAAFEKLVQEAVETVAVAAGNGQPDVGSVAGSETASEGTT